MSIASQIGRVSSNIEVATRAGEFVAIARCLMMSKGIVSEARQIAERRFTQRVVDVFQKAPVNHSRPLAAWPNTPA